MWVFTGFDGDDDDEVAWKQHDVYGDALGIIVRTFNGLRDPDHELRATRDRAEPRPRRGLAPHRDSFPGGSTTRNWRSYAPGSTHAPEDPGRVHR